MIIMYAIHYFDEQTPHQQLTHTYTLNHRYRAHNAQMKE